MYWLTHLLRCCVSKHTLDTKDGCIIQAASAWSFKQTRSSTQSSATSHETPKASLWTSKVSTWYHKRYLGISYVKINKKKIGLIICYRNKRKYVRQIKDVGTKLVTYCVCSHTFSPYAQSLCCLFCKHMQILCIQDPQSTACHVHTKNCIVFLQNVWISKWVTSTLTKIRSNFFVLIHGYDFIVFTYFWQTHLRIKTIKILFLHPSWPSK